MPSVAPRARVLARTRRSLAAADPGAANDVDLVPGQIRLHSYVKPPLTAGRYNLKAEQSITLSSDPSNELRNLTSNQVFNVSGPRYALPTDAIHQIYPPPGHEDASRILPHVVLEDWMLPWEQEVKSTAATKALDQDRQRVPWMALLAFTEQEIGLSKDEVADLNLQQGAAQNKTTLAVNTTIGAASKAVNPGANGPPPTWISTITPEKDGETLDTNQSIDMVFIKDELYNRLFGTYGPNGETAPTTPPNQLPDLSRYALMAHVREINTAGMANAGVEDKGKFSVIVSPRSGPLLKQDDQPVSVHVHLVSLLGVDTTQLPTPTGKRVGVVSLYSWSYTCHPEYDAWDKLRELGRQLDRGHVATPDGLSVELTQRQGEQGWLRSSNYWKLPSLNSLNIAERMFLGFDLIRFKATTGENTVAWMKAPLEPALTVHPKPNLPSTVDNSMALAQLDSNEGILDLTYAAAWELGKALAIADRAFTAALVRLRKHTNAEASNRTSLSLGLSAATSSMVLKNLPAMVAALENLPKNISPAVPQPSNPRNVRGKPIPLASAPTHTPAHAMPQARDLFHAHMFGVLEELASSKTDIKTSAAEATAFATADPTSANKPYNEYNTPYSADWALVLKWVMDRLYLYNIPAHYLIGDPSKLPPETLRFFYIDANWTDALIDGALSLGNHFDRKQDKVRVAIKKRINAHLSTNLDDAKHPYPPQVPTFGFLLRSEMVQKVPNLEVHATRYVSADSPPDPRCETLRLETLSSDVLLCLFDRLPGSSDFKEVVIQQPPHQQRFAAGAELGLVDPGSVPTIKVEVRKLFDETADPPPDKDSWGGAVGTFQSSQHGSTPSNDKDGPTVYDFDLHSILPREYASACIATLTDPSKNTPKKQFSDTVPNAALLAYQLNDAIMKLTITVNNDPNYNIATRPDWHADEHGVIRPTYRQLSLASISQPTTSPASLAGTLLQDSTPDEEATPAKTMENPTAHAMVAAAATSPPASIWPPQYVAGRSRPVVLPDEPIDQIRKRASAFQTIKGTDGFIPDNAMDKALNLTSLMSYAVFKLGTAGQQPINLITTPQHQSVNGLPPADQLPVDLVFSIKRKNSPDNPNKETALMSITIEIPQDRNSNLALMYRYTGLGVEMVGSNQRWIAVLGTSITRKEECLSIKLIPRKLGGVEDIALNRSISFVLHGVLLNANKSDSADRLVHVYATEHVKSKSKKNSDSGCRIPVTIRMESPVAERM